MNKFQKQSNRREAAALTAGQTLVLLEKSKLYHFFSDQE